MLEFKRFTLCLPVLLLVACATTRPAAEKSSLPAPTRHVTDLAGILAPEDIAILEAELKALEASGLAQMIIYVAPSVEGKRLEEVTLEAANSWGVGSREKNNGLVLFLFTEDRNMRLEVGKGLEKVITHDLARVVIKDILAPAIREKEYARGLRAAVERLRRELEKE